MMPKATASKRTKHRTVPKRERELAFLRSGAVVAGVDEVGRGAWAGPVVAGAVILDPDYRIRKAYDSKQMTAAEREQLDGRIRQRALAVGIGVTELAEVNQYGLSWAIQAAGNRAIADLGTAPTQLLLDGKHNYFGDAYACEVIIKGDSRELCIAAASVVAKVARDRMMVELHQTYPEYGFADHKGYGTAQHRDAIREHGVCDVHRTGWAPIAAALQTQLFAA